MKQLFTVLTTALLLLFLSCNQNDIEIVPDNVAPPTNSATTVEIQNYINKIHIDLLGREPLAAEMDNRVNQLKAADLSVEMRNTILTELIGTDEYHDRLFTIISQKYLAGADVQYIDYSIALLEQASQQTLDAGNPYFAAIIDQEVDKLYLLKEASQLYKNGSISFDSYMFRITYNFIYDEINMGSTNFVLSCFENFHRRLPTDLEKENGVTMVDGFPSQILGQDGSSKSEFIEIIMGTPGFYEGIILNQYQQLLVREPNSIELANTTIALSNHNDLGKFQKEIMSSTEYAGF